MAEAERRALRQMEIQKPGEMSEMFICFLYILMIKCQTAKIQCYSRTPLWMCGFGQETRGLGGIQILLNIWNMKYHHAWIQIQQSCLTNSPLAPGVPASPCGEMIKIFIRSDGSKMRVECQHQTNASCDIFFTLNLCMYTVTSKVSPFSPFLPPCPWEETQNQVPKVQLASYSQNIIVGRLQENQLPLSIRFDPGCPNRPLCRYSHLHRPFLWVPLVLGGPKERNNQFNVFLFLNVSTKEVTYGNSIVSSEARYACHALRTNDLAWN